MNDETKSEIRKNAEAAPEARPVLTPEQRKAKLADRVAIMVNTEGYRVESQTDYQAVMVKGKPVNNVLHLILTLVTLGLWLLVWLPLLAFGGEKRKIVSIDEYGNTLG